MPEGDHYGRSM